MQEQQPVRLFYSYSHKDARLLDKLQTHLSLLRRQSMISEWHDRQITAGQPFDDTIDRNLEVSRVILLLVSADFLHSDYCFGKEMIRAMQMHEAGDARVIPVILREVNWQEAPFGRLKALPTDGKPVTS